LLSLLFLIPSYRVAAFYITIIVSVIFILWIMSVYLFTHYLFWPYHALWEKSTWMQKMLISAGMSWLAFTAILLSGNKFTGNKTLSKLLRNMPANAS